MTDRTRATSSRIRLRVLRQDGPNKPETRRFEEFTVEAEATTTVCSALFGLQLSPVTSSGTTVAPVAFDSGCLEASCGSCTMLINGKVLAACTTRLEAATRGGTVTLSPLSKFPVVRDLVVDRSRLFRGLDEVLQSDPLPALAAAQTQHHSPEHQSLSYTLSRCTSCGACLEACPEVHKGGAFVGPSLLHQVRRLHRAARDDEERNRLVDAVMSEGGIADCGKAQNCVEVCPAEIPLADSIQQLARAASKRLLFGWWTS